MKATRSLALLLLLSLLLGLAAPALAQIPPIDPYRFNITVTFSPESVVAGQEFTVTVTVDTLLAGDLTYYYKWSSPNLDLDGYFGTDTDNIAFSIPDEYTLAVTVTLTNGLLTLTRTAEKTMKVLPVQPLEAEISLDREFAVQGEKLSVSVAAKGGVPPYEYFYQFKYKDKDVVFGTILSKETSVVQPLPTGLTEQTTCRIWVQVIDSSVPRKKASAFKELEVYIYGLSLTLNANSFQAGETLQATVKPLGGKPPYYRLVTTGIKDGDCWYWSERGIYTSGESQYTHKLTYGQSGTLTVFYLDDDGEQTAQSAAFTITGSPPAAEGLQISSYGVNNDKPKEGETLTASIEVEGGVPPYRILVENYDSADKLLGKAEAAGLEVPFTVPKTNRLKVVFTAFDKDGRHADAKGDIHLNITPHPRLAGDANGDGSVDLKDMMQIVNYIKTGTFCTFMRNADADEKDGVDIKDLAYIVNLLVK